MSSYFDHLAREAEALRAAIAQGDAEAETHLALARALLALRRYDEAEAAFREAISRNPAPYDAHFELAELRWLRTGDVSQALSELDAAIAAAPNDLRLSAAKAAVLQAADKGEESFALLFALTRAHPNEPQLTLLAAQAAAAIGSPDALALAERAAAMAPNQRAAQIALVEARLGAGEAERAATICENLRQSAPDDQYVIALHATALRLLGDPRYGALYDYGGLVWSGALDTPPGWSSLGAYLAALAAALRGAHAHQTHPFGQSVRHGSQAADILAIDHPAIRALPRALDPPIRQYMAHIGRGDDPMRVRNTNRCKPKGMWSILNRAGGYHVDHVHPDGWLSSACYVDVPEFSRGHEGWLRFGKPGVRTKPELDAEHFMQPAPGKLVLFPSYMWHGTIPFTDPGERLTFAFDAIPAS